MCMTTHRHTSKHGALPTHEHQWGVRPHTCSLSASHPPQLSKCQRERERGQIRIRSAINWEAPENVNHLCINHSQIREIKDRGRGTFNKGRTSGKFLTRLLVLHTPAIYLWPILTFSFFPSFLVFPLHLPIMPSPVVCEGTGGSNCCRFSVDSVKSPSSGF